jgi:hypothetical protein
MEYLLICHAFSILNPISQIIFTFFILCCQQPFNNISGASSSPSSSSALQPWVGLDLLKQTSPATSIQGSANSCNPFSLQVAPHTKQYFQPRYINFTFNPPLYLLPAPVFCPPLSSSTHYSYSLLYYLLYFLLIPLFLILVVFNCNMFSHLLYICTADMAFIFSPFLLIFCISVALIICLSVFNNTAFLSLYL